MNSDEHIDGERGRAHGLVVRARAASLYRAIGIGLLACATIALVAWYVAHVRAHAAERQEPVSLKHAAARTDAALPPLEMTRGSPTMGAPISNADGAGTVVATPAVQGGTASHAAAPDDAVSSHSNAVPRRAIDSAPVLARTSSAALSAPPSPGGGPPTSWSDLPEPADLGMVASAEVPRATASSRMPSVDALRVPDLRLLLPRGAFLDCTLETAIDSTLPGLATCIIATDVYGADGRVVLMERGTRLIGQAKADVRAGQSRVAVVWEEARTPAGVRLDLASAATDALGRTGVPGRVDRHLGDRFGAAVLLSLVEAVASTIASRHEASSAVFYNSRATTDIATEALRGSIGIAPTVRVDPGARISVIVASDISFRSVYRLESHGPG